ncbi:MAG: DUF6600 domain-containing protein [Chthoniobacterales bacterium]
MKRFCFLPAVFAVIAVLYTVSLAKGAVSSAVFYQALAPYGQWVDVAGYGYCFAPQVNEAWHPYTDGYWAFTDLGWTWVSNEDWGWATYHYGRWLLLKKRGWVWVPGREWAPAWVSWRIGSDYIGWAPLPPEVVWAGDSEIELGANFQDVGPAYYSFCTLRDFGASNLHSLVLPASRNVYILADTENVTHLIRTENASTPVVYNYGPDFDMLSRRSERPIPHMQVERRKDFVISPGEDGVKIQNQVRGDRFIVVAPEVQPVGSPIKPPHTASPAGRSEIDDGYSGIADTEKSREVRERIRAQVTAREQQANYAAREYLLERQRAGIQQQTTASQQAQQQRMKKEQEERTTQQQQLNFQQQQRLTKQQSVRQQIQLEQQQMNVQRLKSTAQQARLPQQQVQAQQQEMNILQQSQQNRTDSLQQQRQLQLQQMQIQMQKLQNNSRQQKN